MRGGSGSGGRFFSLLWACPDPRRGRGLPVLQLLREALGEAAAEQPHHEEQRHAAADHRQDVVLGRGRHHLHGEV